MQSFFDAIIRIVDFPLEGLDMSPWIGSEESKQGGAIYDLYAISNHMGGMGGGHCMFLIHAGCFLGSCFHSFIRLDVLHGLLADTAYAKNLNNNTWYCFDDSHVSPVGSMFSPHTLAFS
jgi:ubiquitin carboxyl-terminal hydrolase 4/11/15